MPAHLDATLDAMQDVIERARLRDSGETRALRRAIMILLIHDEQNGNPAVVAEHREWLSECVDQLRQWFPTGELNGIPREHVWDDIYAHLAPKEGS